MYTALNMIIINIIVVVVIVIISTIFNYETGRHVL